MPQTKIRITDLNPESELFILCSIHVCHYIKLVLINYGLWGKSATAYLLKKFYWNTVMLNYLYIVYGCFCFIVAELSSHGKLCVPSMRYLLYDA